MLLLGIKDFIDLGICLSIFFSHDMFERIGFELVEGVPCFDEELLDGGFFDLPVATQLLDDELTVGETLDLCCTEFFGFFEGRDDGAVFGKIIGLCAEVFAVGGDNILTFVFDNNACGGWSWVTAGTAVGIDGDFHKRNE